MKTQFIKDLIVFLIMFGVILIICYFLPNNVPIHFNSQGKSDIIVNKYFVLLGTIIPYSVYLQFFRKKNK